MSTTHTEFFTTCPTDILVAYAVHFANVNKAEELSDVLRVLAARGVEVK